MGLNITGSVTVWIVVEERGEYSSRYETYPAIFLDQEKAQAFVDARTVDQRTKEAATIENWKRRDFKWNDDDLELRWRVEETVLMA